MIKHIISLALGLAVAAGGSAVANDIYKWTDAEGNVHYEDRPTEDADAERLEIRSSPTDKSRIAAQQQARIDARAAAPQNEAGEEAAEGPTPEQLLAAKKERAAKCTSYKSRLQGMLQSRRLYREDGNGERVYLSDEEMQASRQDTAAKVEEYCSKA